MSFFKSNPLFSTNKDVNEFVDKFMNKSLSEIIGSDFVNNQPAVNIIEDTDKFLIELAAPGLEKKDFNLKVEKDRLVLSVAAKETKEGEEKTDKKFTRREFDYRGFKRSFPLSEKVDKQQISAKYEHGILVVTLPFIKESEADIQTIKIS